ncbi:hypothetical protein JCM31271_28090 [Halorubrum trueperi]
MGSAKCVVSGNLDVEFNFEISPHIVDGSVVDTFDGRVFTNAVFDALLDAGWRGCARQIRDVRPADDGRVNLDRLC